MLVKTTVFLLLLLTLVSGGKKTPEELAVQKELKETKKLHNKYEAEPYVKRCPLGWNRLRNEKCFKLFTNLTTHALAEAACNNVGSTLASITSVGEKNFIQSLILKEVELETDLISLWTGLRKKANQFFWFDLTPFNQEGIPFAPGEPSNAAGNDCGYVATDYTTLVNATTEFSHLKMTDCNQLKGFLCQKILLDYCSTESRSR